MNSIQYYVDRKFTDLSDLGSGPPYIGLDNNLFTRRQLIAFQIIVN